MLLVTLLWNMSQAHKLLNHSLYNMPFISIQLNSNRPKSIIEFFDNIEATADKSEDIEVLLHIDAGDKVMEEVVEKEKSRRKFTLRVLQTDLVKSYATLWKPLNPLFKMTHPEAYFVSNLFDEVRFRTKGWDNILRQYEGYYPDHIFRLRCSKYRFRNYTDFWECGFAPDSLAFYTRRWLEISGDWNPCLGPDSFQQCVAFYLYTSDDKPGVQYNRDIAIPDMRFTGEGAGLGLEGEARYRRLAINTRAWFVLMSHTMQQEAKRRAMRIKAHIIAGKNGIVEEKEHRHVFIVSDRASLKVVGRIPYRISWCKTSLVTWLRVPFMLYYAGGGDALRDHTIASTFLVLSSHSPYGAQLLEKVANMLKPNKGIWRRIKCEAKRIQQAILAKLSCALCQEISGIMRRFIRMLFPYGKITADKMQVINNSDAVSPGVQYDNEAIFISILLTGNNPRKVTDFLDTIERTAAYPEKIEVITTVHDKEVQSSVRRLKLRYITQSDPFSPSDKMAYFVARLNEDIRFETAGWDKELEKYTGYHPDHIFRLRCSGERFHNYTSLRDCSASPDTITFYTHKWVSLQDDPACGEYNIFQQYVAFYLFTSNPFSHTQHYRDIAVPHIHFSGEAEHVHHHTLPYAVRQAAKRVAMLLKANIIAGEALVQFSYPKLIIQERGVEKLFQVQKEDGSVITEVSYSGSRLHAVLSDICRLIKLYLEK